MSGAMHYPITPTPAPRMTRADSWKQRPCVMRYRAFKDEIQAFNVQVPDGAIIRFTMPMPKSWSKKKKKAYEGTPHRAKPDIDNLLKALLDAAYPGDDSHVWAIGGLYKLWGTEGEIVILRGET